MTARPKEVLPPLLTSAATLKEWRKRMDFSQREAARALGCSATALGNWETGANEVPPYIGLAMAALTRRLPPYRPSRAA